MDGAVDLLERMTQNGADFTLNGAPAGVTIDATVVFNSATSATAIVATATSGRKVDGRVMMRLTMAIIYLAPYGVFGLMLYATATQGVGVFQRLGWYMITVALGLVIHGVITLSIILYLFGRRSPLQYAKAMSPALLTAFSSSAGVRAIAADLNDPQLGRPAEYDRLAREVGSVVHCAADVNWTLSYEGLRAANVLATTESTRTPQTVTAMCICLRHRGGSWTAERESHSGSEEPSSSISSVGLTSSPPVSTTRKVPQPVSTTSVTLPSRPSVASTVTPERSASRWWITSLLKCSRLPRISSPLRRCQRGAAPCR